MRNLTGYILFSLCLFNLLAAETLSPEEALRKLMRGNARYVNNQSVHPNRSEERKAFISYSQRPFATILACADSRVPPEIIFDQGLGDLFVVRVAANLAGTLELSSIEFAAAVLETRLILVLGHQRCGAVDAILNGTAKKNCLESLVSYLQPAVDKAKDQLGDPLTNVVKANILLMVDRIRASPIIEPLLKNEKVLVVGGFFDLETGEVLLLPRSLPTGL